MQSHEIRQALKKKELNFSIVADALGVSPQHVSRVASRNHTSYRVAEALAKAIGMDIIEVFPDIQEYRSRPKPRKKVRAEKVANLKQVITA